MSQRYETLQAKNNQVTTRLNNIMRSLDPESRPVNDMKRKNVEQIESGIEKQCSILSHANL